MDAIFSVAAVHVGCLKILSEVLNTGVGTMILTGELWCEINW